MKLTAFISTAIHRFLMNNSFSTARNYQSTEQSVSTFQGKNEIPLNLFFQHDRLIAFQDYLLRKGLLHNTVAFYMRILHALYSSAVQQKLIDPIEGLFKNIILTSKKTAKRALTFECVQRIAAVNLSGHRHLMLSRDMFILSILLQGISFIDLAHLTKAHRRGNTIVFSREKTDEEVVISLTPYAKAILDKYYDPDSVYLLPIMKHVDDPERQDELYRNALRNYNRHLKSIAILAEVDENISSHTARHTFATLAYHEGVQLSVISQALGHSNRETTNIYIKSFGNDTILKANLIVENLIFPPVKKKQKEEKEASDSLEEPLSLFDRKKDICSVLQT